jgi:Pvc16 N-terminal domain
MSSPLAIAGVTAVLKDHLNKGSINIDLDLASIGPFTVSALPPDRIQTGANEENRINLFLYQVTPNQGWRNQGMPSIGSNGERLSNPPLALDLHYMLTTYGKEDLNAEVLWGYAMELFHELVLDRSDIRNLLSLIPANPLKIAQIPPDEDGRTAVDLADQIEQIKITPNYLSADELSRLWTAMQARYRPTMVYQVSTVLIQRKKPTRSPLPVLARGEKDRGIDSQPNLQAPPPTKPTLRALTIREPTQALTREAAELGDTLILEGALLEGKKVTALFSHKLLAKPLERPIKAGATAARVEIELPKNTDANAPRDWPAGPYSVSLQIERAGKPTVLTNVRFCALAPRISAAPVVAGGANKPTVTVQFFPEIRDSQRVELFVGGDPFKPAPFVGNVSSHTIPLTGIKPIEGTIPIGLRVDGVDSILVRDTTAKPPQFEPQQTIVLPI